MSAAPAHHGRILELDGLRALAIIPVIFYHCFPLDSRIAPLGAYGWVGVDLFFVLSGFLITGILVRSKSSPHYYRNFIVRRTLRIFPLYYLCLTVFTLAVRFNAEAWNALRAWGGPGWFFFYLGNVRSAVVSAYPPVFSFAPLWSLQIEEQYYLLFPFIVLSLSLVNLRRFLIGCVIVAPVLRGCFFLFHQPQAAYVLMPCRMDALALGGLIGIAAAQPVRVRFDIVAVIGALGTAAMFAYLHRTGQDIPQLNPLFAALSYSLIDLTCAALLAHIVFTPQGTFSWLLRWRPLTYVGQIAYGLYLLHGPASWAVRGMLGRAFSVKIPSHSWLSVPVTFGAALVAAGLTWKFFEQPILRLKDTLSSPALEDNAKIIG